MQEEMLLLPYPGVKYALSYSPGGFQLGFFCHRNHRMVSIERDLKDHLIPAL